MSDYNQSRISLVVCGILLVLELALLIFGLKAGNLSLAIVSILITSALFLILFSASVHVSRDAVVVSYGVGVLRQVISLQDIQRMDIVANNSLLSVFEPGREHVLRLTLRSGKRVTVPVGDAKRMMEVISAHNRR